MDPVSASGPSDILDPPPLDAVDHLIVGVDGSSGSRAALRFASMLAEGLGVHLTVVTSWEHPATAILPGGPHSLPSRAEGDATAAALLDRVLIEDLGGRPPHAEPLVLLGRPASSLVHLARNHPGTVVVVGPTGGGGFPGMVLGSTTRALLHDDRVPVIVVSSQDPSATHAPSIDDIVVGVDGSPGSEAALRWAGGVAANLGATIVAVHGLGLATTGLDQEAAAQVCTAVRQELEGPWSVAARELGVPVHTVLCDDDPREAILRVADESSAGLVVVGRSSGHGFARWAIGNVAESVVRHSKRPIAVVADVS